MAKRKNTSEGKSASTTPAVGSSAQFFDLVRLLARQAAQLDFKQSDTKDDERHD
jgi:hypothetical protein